MANSQIAKARVASAVSALVVTFTLLGAVSRAEALEDEPAILYSAPPVCPGSGAFIERVRSRTARGTMVRAGDAPRFVVTLRSSDTESSGTVEFAGVAGERVVRRVAGRTCDEVVSAAALITALAIEATIEPSPPEPPELKQNAAEMRALAETPPAPAPRSASWAIGATGGMDSWSAPTGAYVASAFGELTSAAPFRFVRLGFRAASGSVTIDERSATFLMLGGRLSACPISLELANGLEMAPCAGIDLGRLAGHGEQSPALPEPRRAAILWAAGVTELSLRWYAAKILVVHGGAELGFPLVRHSFIFEGPTRLIHEVPAIGVGASVGAAVRFH